MSDGLDLKNRTSMKYIVRQYVYYVSYNIGHLIYFPYGMDHGSFGTGFAALITGCIGMLIAISMTGEVIAYGRRKMRGNQGSVLSPKTQITRFEVVLI